MLGFADEFRAFPSHCLNEAESRLMRRCTQYYKRSEEVFRKPVEWRNAFSIYELRIMIRFMTVRVSTPLTT